MKTPCTKYLTFLFIPFLIIACESKEEPTPNLRLNEVGFVGTLPDGRSFSTSGIKSANSAGLSGSSIDGGFVHHGLVLRDEVSGLDIYLQLPEKKFQESHEIFELDAINIANEYYDYNTVKEMLAVGNKKIPFNSTDTWQDNFYITVLDQRNYNGYTLIPGLLEEGNFLKVMELIEGIEQNAAGENIRIIDIIFDVDVKMHTTDEGLEPHGNLKGQLRMKYRENFDQSELGAN